MRSGLISVVLGLSLVAVPLQAAELQVLGGVTLGFALGGDKGKRSDFNPHIEAEFANVYGGVEAHVYNDGINTEIAPYIGYRAATAGGLSFAVSYRRSVLPNDGGDCCGNIAVALGLPVGSRLVASLDMGLRPETGDNAVALGVDVAAFDQVRWSGCRPPQTASECAKVVVLNATRKGGRRNEGYDDWG